MVKNLNSSGEIIKIAGDRKFGEHCMTDINDEKLEWFKEAQRYNTYLHDYDKQKKKHLCIKDFTDIPENWDEVESVFMVCEDNELVKKIPYILKVAKNLKKLSVSRYYFDWEELVALDMKKLELLNVNIKQIYYAPRLCLPDLKTLILSCSEDNLVKDASENYEEHMDYSGLNNLNRLELYYMADISPDDFSDVATLEYLRLMYNYGSNLEWLKNTKYRLKTLIVDHGVEDCSDLKYQRSIEILEFFYHRITDVSAIEQLTNLKRLDLGRDLIKDEGNLRNMGIEWIQITRRDYDIKRIYDEVKGIVQIAVKEDLNRKQRYEENKNKKIFLQKADLEDFLEKSFGERIKILVKEIYHRRIEKFHTKDGQKAIDSRFVKVLSVEEYIQCFRQKANEYYPFLSEPYEGESIKTHTKEEYMKSVLDSFGVNSDIKIE